MRTKERAESRFVCASLLAQLVQTVVMVDPCRVAVAPAELKRIATYGLNARGTNVGIDRFSSDDSFSRMLIDAACAGALEAKFGVGNRAFHPVAPGNQDLFWAERFNFFRNWLGLRVNHGSQSRSSVEPDARLM